MKIVIINTDCANILSVVNVINKLGYQVTISTNIKHILQADKILLPGVGTAQSVMKILNQTQITNIIRNYTKPILGICLGMQLFSIHSEENSNIETLRIIQTPVKKIKHLNFPLPHMGWNTVKITKQSKLFQKIGNKNYFYFAHSYAFPTCNDTIAETNYGYSFSAAIEYKNFFGVQFHPEKSGSVGKQLFKNFLEI